jgi:single-stranded-DNA-specific exonuclease RecJ
MNESSKKAQTTEKIANKLWIYPSCGEPAADLVAASGSEILASILKRRGFDTVELIQSFLDETLYKPSHYLELPNTDKAIERLSKAIDKGEKISVYGDYDVDGVTGTSVLLSVLRKLGANVDFYIPNRASEGYGLNLKAVSVLASKHRTKLIVTCDCGVSNFSEINLAKSLGVDTLVLDHHTMPDMLPPAVAVVHPKLLADSHPLFNLPGVGVAYKVCEGLLEKYGRSEETAELLDFVTLGMIADLVPLVKENRYLVKIGLTRLVNSQRPGIKALLTQVGGKEDTDLVGFGLAPRINAVGRLSDASAAVELMTTEDEVRADELAKQLARENLRRQELCEKIYMEAEHKVLNTCNLDNDKGIVIYNEGWHHGVVGIVASRLVEKFQRPVFIGELDTEENVVRGSARGVEQIDLYEVLKASEHLLQKWGGHKMAAGFTIEADKAEAAARAIVASCNKFLGEKSLRGRIELDTVVPAHVLTLDVARHLNSMAPFGMSNKKPIIAIEKLSVVSVRPLGKENKHSRLILRDEAGTQEFECVMWNSRGRTPDEGSTVDLAFNAGVNAFGGRERLQLVMVDWRKPGFSGVSDSDSEPKALNNGKSANHSGLNPAPALATVDAGLTEDDDSTSIDVANLTEATNLLKSQALVRVNFKDLRDYAGNFEVIKKAGSKLTGGIFVYGESGNKPKGIDFQDRTQVAPCDNLLIWQYPPALKNFQELLFATRAKNIYVIGNCDKDEIVDEDAAGFLKQLLGVVRFAVNQRDGQVEGDKLAAVLGASKMSIALALAALKRVHWIDWFSENGTIYLDLLGAPVASVEETPEFKQLVASLSQTDKFRRWCAECTMKELQLALIPNQIGLAAEPEALASASESGQSGGKAATSGIKSVTISTPDDSEQS